MSLWKEHSTCLPASGGTCSEAITLKLSLAQVEPGHFLSCLSTGQTSTHPCLHPGHPRRDRDGAVARVVSDKISKSPGWSPLPGPHVPKLDKWGRPWAGHYSVILSPHSSLESPRHLEQTLTSRVRLVWREVVTGQEMDIQAQETDIQTLARGLGTCFHHTATEDVLVLPVFRAPSTVQ